MATRTRVSAALRQAHELIEHAERNNQAPDRVWLAQLGRAYASSVRAEMADNLRYFTAHIERRDADCERLSRAIGQIGIRLSEAESELANRAATGPEPDAREDVPGDGADIGDSFTPDEHRSFLERCMGRLRPGN